MKNSLSIFSILLFPLLLFGQKLKPQKSGNEFYRQEFNILKSGKVRQGEYKNYKNGQLNITGYYEEGKKVGDWKYYENGNLVQSYNYSEGVLSSINSNFNYKPFIDNQYVDGQLQSPPTYIGGKPGLERELNDFMEYPLQARQIVLEGLVIFTVVIDERGIMNEIEFVEGPKEFYDEIKKGLLKIEQRWQAGSNTEGTVKSKLYCTIEFKLLICGGYGCSTIFIR